MYASSLSSACLFDPSRTKAPRKKENSQKKSPSKTFLISLSRTVGTQKWTTRADYWPPTEAMCMAPQKHPPLFMGNVGIYPLHRACVSFWCHAIQPQKRVQECRHGSAPQTVFLWSVCTPYWTLRPVFGTPVEGMRVTSSHWQELVDMAGILSLAGTRFGPVTQPAVTKWLFFGQKRRF